jgi:hypothetical protein
MRAESNPFSIAIATSRAPSWFSALEEGVWANVGDNSMGDVSPDNTYGLTKAWIGAAIDPVRREMVIPLPGGHGARSDSDLYVFRFGEDSPRWYRPRTGTTGFVEDFENASNLNDSGEPSATHTYHRPVCARGHVWLPGIDSMSSPAGYWTTATFSYPLAIDDAPWRSHGRLITEGSINKWLGGSACYDAVSDRIFSCPQYGTRRWASFRAGPRLAGPDVAYPARVPGVTVHENFISDPNYNVMVAASDLRLLILLDNSGRVYTADADLDTPEWVEREVSGSGTSPFGGFCYHPGTRRCYAWENSRNTIFTLSIPERLDDAWRWSQVVTDGVTLPNANEGGTYADGGGGDNGDNHAYGRFNIVPDMGDGRGCLVFYPRWTHAGMLVCKLPASGL